MMMDGSEGYVGEKIPVLCLCYEQLWVNKMFICYKAQYFAGPTNKTKHVFSFSLSAVKVFQLFILLCPIDFLSCGICLSYLQHRENQY